MHESLLLKFWHSMRATNRCSRAASSLHLVTLMQRAPSVGPYSAFRFLLRICSYCIALSLSTLLSCIIYLLLLLILIVTATCSCCWCYHLINNICIYSHCYCYLCHYLLLSINSASHNRLLLSYGVWWSLKTSFATEFEDLPRPLYRVWGSHIISTFTKFEYF